MTTTSKFPRHLARLFLVLLLVPVLFGCAAQNPLLTPRLVATQMAPVSTEPADPSQVRIIEAGQPISAPYEILGQVTILTPGYEIAAWKKVKAGCLAEIKKEAAAMGADAVMGYYTYGFVHHTLYDEPGFIDVGPGHPRQPGDFASGIAIRFLKDGEAPKHTRGDFIAAIIPMQLQDKNPERARFIEDHVQRDARLELTEKGYYVLPDAAVLEKQGFLELIDEKNPGRNSVGGDQTEYLLGLQMVDRSGTPLILFSVEDASLQVSLFSKKAGRIIASNQGSGTVVVSWLWNAMMPNLKRIGALNTAVYEAMKPVPDIATTREMLKRFQ